MKILFVHNRYLQSAGGEDATVDAEVKLLRAKGHEVEVLLFSNDGFGGSTLNKIKAGLRSIYNVQSREQVKQAIRQFSPDIIHVHNFYFQASPAVFDAASQCQVPVVMTVHNFRLVCVNAFLLRDNRVCEDCLHSFFPWKGVVHKCYHDSIKDSAMVGMIAASHKLKHTWTKKVDRYITVSDFMRGKLLHSSLGLRDDHKMVVKRNFIEDPGMGAPEARGADYLFVGRLSEEKGVDFLLRTFSHLPHEQLLVVGDGPQKDELINRYGSCTNITFAGKKDKPEVIRLMKHCRALIFPSIWYEGLPITLIEAMATGTPVLASNLGAMQEMIRPGENGILFETEQQEALSQSIDAMNTVASRGDLSLYHGARAAYMAHYHPDACYATTLSIYQSVINERQKSKTS